MTQHKTGTREEWTAARLELLAAEKELTRRGDELALQRQQLPWVRVDKNYRFETGAGSASLADLFEGRSQLMVYHFMFGPDYTAGCPSCSMIADGFNGFAVHLANHDVTLCAVSRAPLVKLQTREPAYEWRPGELGGGSGPVEQLAAGTGTDAAAYTRERPGMSTFVREDGVIHHTYSTYSRGVDGIWGAYQWLDRAPKGRNETGIWWRRHDEYEAPAHTAGAACCA